MESKREIILKNAIDQSVKSNIVVVCLDVPPIVFEKPHAQYIKLETPTDDCACLAFILQTKTKRVFLIMSSNAVHYVIPLVCHHSCLERIFVYNEVDDSNEQKAVSQMPITQYFMSSSVDKIREELCAHIDSLISNYWLWSWPVAVVSSTETENYRRRRTEIHVVELLLKNTSRIHELSSLDAKTFSNEEACEKYVREKHQWQSRLFLVVNGVDVMTYKLASVIDNSAVVAAYFLRENHSGDLLTGFLHDVHKVCKLVFGFIYVVKASYE